MKKLFYSLGILLIAVGLTLGCVDDDFWDSIIPETDEEATQSQINGYVFKPALVPATEERIQQLGVPDGFNVRKFADNLGKPRILVASNRSHFARPGGLAIHPGGSLFIFDDTNGTIYRVVYD